MFYEVLNSGDWECGVWRLNPGHSMSVSSSRKHDNYVSDGLVYFLYFFLTPEFNSLLSALIMTSLEFQTEHYVTRIAPHRSLCGDAVLTCGHKLF